MTSQKKDGPRGQSAGFVFVRFQSSLCLVLADDSKGLSAELFGDLQTGLDTGLLVAEVISKNQSGTFLTK